MNSKNKGEAVKEKRENYVMKFFTAHQAEDGTWYVNANRMVSGNVVKEYTQIDGISEKAAKRIVDCGTAFVNSIREAVQEQLNEGDTRCP